jgi:hypothetical protein
VVRGQWAEDIGECTTNFAIMLFFSCLWNFFHQKKFIFFCGFGLRENMKLRGMDEEKGLKKRYVAKQKYEN